MSDDVILGLRLRPYVEPDKRIGFFEPLRLSLSSLDGGRGPEGGKLCLLVVSTQQRLELTCSKILTVWRSRKRNCNAPSTEKPQPKFLGLCSAPALPLRPRLYPRLVSHFVGLIGFIVREIGDFSARFGARPEAGTADGHDPEQSYRCGTLNNPRNSA